MLRQALILVGGMGTRLGELTLDLPKPMMPVGAVPLLEHPGLESPGGTVSPTSSSQRVTCPMSSPITSATVRATG